MVDFRTIEHKWKCEWQKQKAFEADAQPGKKKFFLTFPYPYMNGYLHLGHFYSIMRAEVVARYKRLQGYHVLFPQAWHCTGSPIESVAKRIREKEPRQLETMRKSGFSEADIEKFADPKHWTVFFPKAAKKDLQDLGMSIDFRREFITTNLNPYYTRFIEWQFRKLKEAGYVVKGDHPVVWCPKDKTPVGDHDRVEGEGETPQEHTLMKYKCGSFFLVATTLRPETLFADTNVWVHPDVGYVRATVDGEEWLISDDCATKLREQDHEVEILGTIKGKDVLGKSCSAPLTGKELPILPATFCDPSIGTGIVRSVPSHAPFDWAALHHLQQSRKECEKYGLEYEKVKAIQPISIITVEGFGEHPAIDICKQMKITSPEQTELLDKATKEIYKKEFHTGVMKQNTGDFAGMKVEQAKNAVRKKLLDTREGAILYELTGKVVCRCLTPAVVKIVHDQWFVHYAHEKWKKAAHECLHNMQLYPEKSRQHFEYVIDWMNDWACVREYGLGTKLPWDKKWVIEALSDSTIYMAYYTIAHLIEKEPLEYIDDSFFDYVFLSEGKPNPALKHAEEMKKEFEYWYPMDFRNSGKDLIQNHLTFCIFNHTAIFPEKRWPQSFGVNGWVLVDGRKMSKSLGNFILLYELVQKYPVDTSRITILSGGEGLDDPNWDSEFAKSCPAKLEGIFELCIGGYNKGSSEERSADKWMESKLHMIIRDATAFMEETMFRSALQKIFFDLPKAMRQYVRKTSGEPNKHVMNAAIEAQTVMLSPFAPFIAEELWHVTGKKELVLNAPWPHYDESKIDEKATFIDDMISDTRKDIDAVLSLAKLDKPSKITLVVAPQWKYELVDMLKRQLEHTRNAGDILKAVMSTSLKQHGAIITKLLPKLLNNTSSIPSLVLSQQEELQAFAEAVPILKDEVKCEVDVQAADTSTHQKAQQALPGKPAIIAE
jgi:leucyl-tRNA synthetase